MTIQVSDLSEDEMIIVDNLDYPLDYTTHDDGGA